MSLEVLQLSNIVGKVNHRVRVARTYPSASNCNTQAPSSKQPYFATKKPRRISIKCSSLTSSDSSRGGEVVEPAGHGHGQQLLEELPLIPLPFVLLPGTTFPLQIFEFRYRIMMQTLLQQKHHHHHHLRFGITYFDKTNGIANVGCVGHVVKHERLVDDRFFLICKGKERFRVANVVRNVPYLVAEVQWLEDQPCTNVQQHYDLECLAQEVRRCMKDVIRLSNKLKGKPEKERRDDICGNLRPGPFSFYAASTFFERSPREQQVLLEMEDTALRLKRERQTLLSRRNYLAAASAVRDAFQYTSYNEN